MTAPTVPSPPPLRWLRYADLFLALNAILLAGLAAAFVARNSDQWLHFAAGRDLLNGRYSLGSDPYSFLSDGRYWANPSWLYDLLAHQLYRIDGTGHTAVLVKAVSFAAALGLVLLIRRPGTPFWPWWQLAGTAVLVAAPYLELRPSIASAFFTSAFLAVLLKCAWKPGSWKLPLFLAALTALWSNFDGWFLVGPAMLLLALVAQLIQVKFQKGEAFIGPGVKDLAKALGLSILAAMLNPHHINVWQLPVELGVGLPEAILADPQFARLRLSPLSQAYRDNASLGRNANGIAFAAMFVLGSAVLAFALPQQKVPSLIIWLFWLFFSLLAVLNVRFLLLFALAAVPLVALPLAEIAAKFALSNQPLYSMLSSVSRLIALPLGLVLMALAWPGWLHPKPEHPAYARRVALGVAADPAFSRTAGVLQQYREEQRIPEEQRGVALAPEFADHVAWFAPTEKVAVNSRFKFHAPELPVLVALREVSQSAYLDLPPLPNPAEEDAARRASRLKWKDGFDAAMKALKADYWLVASIDPTRPIDFKKVAETMGRQDLGLWHLDGRTALLGPGKDSQAIFEPVRLAFRPGQAPLPEPVLNPAPPRQRDPYQDFFDPPEPVPLEALDGLVYVELVREIWSNQLERTKIHNSFRGQILLRAGVLAGGFGHEVELSRIPMLQPNTSDDMIALTLLAHRSARIANAKNPDDPLGYYVLAVCYQRQPTLLPGLNKADAMDQRVAACRRYLDRMPLPSPDLNVIDVKRCTEKLEVLANDFNEQKMLDSFLSTVRLLREYQRQALPKLLAEMHQEKQFEQARKDLDKGIKQIDDQIADTVRGIEKLSGMPKLQQIEELAQAMPEDTIKLIDASDIAKEFGDRAFEVQWLAIDLRLRIGRLEAAVPLFKNLDGLLASEQGDPRQQKYFEVRAKGLFAEAQFIAGDYAGANRTRLEMHRDGPRPPAADLDYLENMVRKADGANISPFDTFGGLGGIGTLIVLGDRFSRINNAQAEEVNFWNSIALNAVLNGSFDDALTAIDKAMNPFGRPLPESARNTLAIQRYKQLIRKGGIAP